MKVLASLLVLVSLVGCAMFSKPADTVSFPRGQAWQAYSDIRVVYSVLRLQVTQACKAKTLGEEACANLPRIHEEMVRIDTRLMKSLANPATEVDWAAVGEALSVIVSLAKLAF